MFTRNFYLKALNSQFRNPNFSLTISHLHSVISKRHPISNAAIEFVQNEAQDCEFSKSQFNSSAQNQEKVLWQKSDEDPKLQISHPWHEWINLMEILSENGYFDQIGNPFASNEELGKKDANLIRTACLKFARGQSQLIRYLSQKNIVMIAGSGCASLDRKVVSAGKRLRAHSGIDEENVCRSCILRGDCERAFVKGREHEEIRTVDVMRLVLPYCLDYIVDFVENKPCLNQKVEESVRTLVKEMVENRVEGHENGIDEESDPSGVPKKRGDWICPKCNFDNFARNVRCLRCDHISEERLKILAAEQDQLPLKKGDWTCEKCHLLNFARNTRCFRCKENPPKRELHPGEWECDSCNYINFRRNMLCLKCDHKRPIASKTTEMESKHVSSNENEKQDAIQPWLKHEKINRGGSLKKQDFMDFPLVGGKSDLSRDVQKQGSWKLKMADRCKTPHVEKEKNGLSKSSISARTYYLTDDDDDDDEMAEWFGRRNISQIVG